MKFFHLKIALGLALREPWLLLAQTQKNTDVYRQPCINHLRDVNYCKSWERTPWHWSRPSWLFLTGCLSLHSWQTAMLAHVGTYWHILAHVGAQLSPHFIHWDNSLSGPVKFFQLKIALGRILAVDCSTKAVFLCTAVKLQSCHSGCATATHWTFQNYNSASNRSAKLVAVRPPAVTKNPNFWAGTPRPP